MNNELNTTVVAFRDRVAAPALLAFGSADTAGVPAGNRGAAAKRNTLGTAYLRSGSA